MSHLHAFVKIFALGIMWQTQMYDHIADTWTESHAMPGQRKGFGAAAFSDEEGILVGGEDFAGAARKEVYRFSIQSGFTPVTAAEKVWTHAQCAQKTLATNGKLVVICSGGRYDGAWQNRQTYVYDVSDQTFTPKTEWNLPAYTSGMKLKWTYGGRVLMVTLDAAYEFRDDEQAADGSYWHPIDDPLLPATLAQQPIPIAPTVWHFA